MDNNILDHNEEVTQSWAKRHPFWVGLIAVVCLLIAHVIIARLMFPHELLHYNMPKSYKPNPDYYAIYRRISYTLAIMQLIIPNLLFMLLARLNPLWQGFEYLMDRGFKITFVGAFFALMLLFAVDVGLMGLIFVSVACAVSAAMFGSISSALIAMILRKDGL